MVCMQAFGVMAGPEVLSIDLHMYGEIFLEVTVTMHSSYTDTEE